MHAGGDGDAVGTQNINLGQFYEQLNEPVADGIFVGKMGDCAAEDFPNTLGWHDVAILGDSLFTYCCYICSSSLLVDLPIEQVLYDWN